MPFFRGDAGVVLSYRRCHRIQSMDLARAGDRSTEERAIYYIYK